MSNDIIWKECNIHKQQYSSIKKKESKGDHGDNDNGNDGTKKYYDDDSHENQQYDNEDEDEDNFGFQLFSPPKEDLFETFEYNFPELNAQYQYQNQRHQNKEIIIKLRGQSDINNSTGLSMWLGSEQVTKYLLQNKYLIQYKTVLELGSGLGLCGLVSYYLGANRVLLTDGDTTVLDNLRYNVKCNLDDQEHIDMDHDKVGGEQSKQIISCPQHIWGHNLNEFEQLHGKSNVIIATDCVYMTQSLEPLWQSIDHLLVDDGDGDGSNDDNNDGNNNNHGGKGVFIYTNRCSSAAPIEMVLQMATKYGFIWTTISPNESGSDATNKEKNEVTNGTETESGLLSTIPANDMTVSRQCSEEEIIADDIFLFRRK